jgi:hypothetical protein
MVLESKLTTRKNLDLRGEETEEYLDLRREEIEEYRN